MSEIHEPQRNGPRLRYWKPPLRRSASRLGGSAARVGRANNRTPSSAAESRMIRTREKQQGDLAVDGASTPKAVTENTPIFSKIRCIWVPLDRLRPLWSVCGSFPRGKWNVNYDKLPVASAGNSP